MSDERTVLPADTVLDLGFGAVVLRSFHTPTGARGAVRLAPGTPLALVERMVSAAAPGTLWSLVIDGPLVREVYDRAHGEWVLVDRSEGFA